MNQDLALTNYQNVSYLYKINHSLRVKKEGVFKPNNQTIINGNIFNLDNDLQQDLQSEYINLAEDFISINWYFCTVVYKSKT